MMTVRGFLPIAICLVSLLAINSANAQQAAEKADSNSAKAKETQVGDISLRIPVDWKEERPSNRLRLAQFQIPAAEGVSEPTEMVVSFFGGTGGGIDANVSRWIAQFTNEGRSAKVTKGKSPLGTYYFVDIQGTYNMPIGPPIRQQTVELPNARMAGVILEVKDQGNYFLKMAGPEKSVSPQINALRASIQGDAASEQPYEY